jgi:hypothetical protein
MSRLSALRVVTRTNARAAQPSYRQEKGKSLPKGGSEERTGTKRGSLLAFRGIGGLYPGKSITWDEV